MTFEFKLPDIGEGLIEGEVVKWHVKEGDAISENQPLCNVLTDKAEVEIPSPKTGQVVKLMAKVGEKVQVHGVLVTIEVANGGSQAQSHASAAKTPAPGPSAAPAAAQDGGGAVNAMPAVRKLAAELKVDLARVKGTGPGGRISEEDVRKTASGAPIASSPEKKSAFRSRRRRLSTAPRPCR